MYKLTAPCVVHIFICLSEAFCISKSHCNCKKIIYYKLDFIALKNTEYNGIPCIECYCLQQNLKNEGSSLACCVLWWWWGEGFKCLVSAML